MKKLTPALILVLAGLAQVAVAAEPAKPAAKADKPAAAKPAAGKPAPAAKAGNKAGAKAAAAPVVEELPADVVKEMNDLVEKAVQPASGPLQNSDDFLPYGVLMHKDGSLQVVRWNQPNPPPKLELLKKIFKAVFVESQKNPDVVAAATVAPSSVPTDDPKRRVNGIRVEVDHRRGEARVVFIPYTHEDGKLVLGTTVYLPGVNPVFAHGEAAAAQGAAAPATDTAKGDAKPAAKAAKPAEEGDAKPAPKADAKPAAPAAAH